MADIFTWGDLPRSQTDPTTIDEAIAAALVVHNGDPDAHLGTGGSLESHRAADIIDHLALSIVTDKLANDPVGFASKSGSGPLWGNDLQTATLDTQRAFSSIVYTTIGGGKWFAIDSSGHLASSTDGATWTTTTVSALSGYNSLAFGNGVLVAAHSFASSQYVYTSPDGATWTQRNTGVTNYQQGVKYVHDRFFMQIGLVNHVDLYESTDGITWTNDLNSTTLAFQKPVYVDGYGWVLTATDSGDGYIYQCPDDFSAANLIYSSSDYFYYEIIFGNGYYWMHAYDRNAGTDFFMVSKTGRSFTRHADIVDPFPTTVMFGLQQFLLVVDDIGDPAIFYSTTLSSAAIGDTPAGFALEACADNGDRICLIGSQSGTPHILYADLPGAT